VTKPALANDKGSNGVRTYGWPPPQGPFDQPEFEVISVTSAVDGGLPKPALVGWAARVTAEKAVDNVPILTAMVDSGQKREATDYLKNARWGESGAKADRGTIVHAALEAYIDGKPLSKETIQDMLVEMKVPEALWKSTGNMIQGVMLFLDEHKPEILHSEKTVFSRSGKYAGTADVIARMKIGSKVVPVIIDIKTAKAIYDDVALQLCAYARAEFIGLPDGTEIPLVEEGEKIEYGVVVRPTASGTYEHAVFGLDDGVYALFLSVLYTATHRDKVLRAARRRK
jgi:hypothetical protein